MTNHVDPVEILLVEDDEGDIELTQISFQRSKLLNNLHIARDGIEALEFLRSPPDKLQPDLILLDLNMPRMDGYEFLKIVKMDEGLKKIPIVVLTTSESEEDVLKSYDLHANAFISKPVGMEGLMSVINRMAEYWFAVVKLPPKE